MSMVEGEIGRPSERGVMNIEPLFSVSNAAKLLGVHAQTIRAWDRVGLIVVVRTPTNHRRIPMSEIERIRRDRGGDDA